MEKLDGKILARYLPSSAMRDERHLE